MSEQNIKEDLMQVVYERSPLAVEKVIKALAQKTGFTQKTLKEELSLLRENLEREKKKKDYDEARKYLDSLPQSNISVSTQDYLKCKKAGCLRLLEFHLSEFNKDKILSWKEKNVEFKDFKIVVTFINEKYDEQNPSVQSVVESFYDKTDLATKIWAVQPYFYDESRLWWVWDNREKYWKIVDDTQILIMVQYSSRADTIKSSERVEILEAMKQYGRTRKPKPIKPTWIQFKDSIVDIETGESFRASPEYLSTNPIPWKLHPEKYENTPTMDRIFEEWVGKEYVKTLYEILAYCLIPNYPIHRIFCFIGSGMNGKSKYLELLRRFIGGDNVCSTELDTLLNSRFEVTRLFKKLVCQMGETNFNEMSKTSILKKLSGGDLIGFEYKNKDPFEDHNYAKIIISTNNLPTTTDKTIGFYRRWMIIDFPNQFSEKKDILAEIPEEEYESLALKSLGILKDLLRKRNFHKEGSIEERMKKYEEHSNPLDKFIELFVKEDTSPEGYITAADFARKFKSWCKENRHREMSDTSIGMSMKKAGYESNKRYFNWMHDGKGGQARVWEGVSWND